MLRGVMKATALGWVVLLAAIIANGLASLIGLSGWYDLLQGNSVSILSWIWMVILYPLMLGAVAWAGLKLLRLEDGRKADD